MTENARRHDGALRELGHGAALLLRGFAGWGARPGLMALGLIPAAIVSLALGTGLIALAANLSTLTDAVTPFADGWPAIWAILLRVALGAATFGAALAVVAVTFTALTLMVGEPLYDRIWRATEQRLTGTVPTGATGFWRGVADALSLVVRGAMVGVLCFLIGLVPIVGGVAGAVLGVTLTGWLLADELTSRALTARGIDRRERRRLLRSARSRVLGFGIMTQLCFLVPLGAVVAMPSAVVGATTLALSLLSKRSILINK